jgi:dolichyl-phosphate-mannose-protein mannosyltransferase
MRIPRPTARQAVVIVAVLSLVTHALWFGHPATTVFDEVHFGKFISAYSTGEYYFDIHPPLGKLIIAGFGDLFGFEPAFSFASIGDRFPDRTYLSLRFLPTLAGTLLAPVIALLVLALGLSATAALFVGSLVALDNALLVQSRLILLDPFLLLFGFGALLCYARWRGGERLGYLFAAGALGAGAVSIKWTGLTFLAIIGLLEAYELVRRWRRPDTARLLRIGLALGVLPLLIYASVFAVHFSLLPRSGQGDAFMTPAFQARLAGNRFADDPAVEPKGLLGSIVELNGEMYRSNKRLDATHPYSSQWYSWPLMTRPIFYWVSDMSRIYLLGNPVVWYGSTVALLLALIALVRRSGRRDRLLWLLMGAYAFNLLPFVGIGRVMFLYHYFTALIIALIMWGWLIDRAKIKPRMLLALLGLALVAFVYFAPLSYGLPLEPQAYEQHVWLSSWR